MYNNFLIFVFACLTIADSTFAQSSPSCDSPKVQEEAFKKAEFENISSRFKERLVDLKSPAQVQARLVEFLTTEVAAIEAELSSKKLTSAQATEKRLSLFQWQNAEMKRSKQNFISTLSFSDFSRITAPSSNEDRKALLSSVLAAQLIDANLSFEIESIRDEDTSGLGQAGRTRIFTSRDALTDKDTAVKNAAMRFLKSHPGKYRIIELSSEVLGNDSSTQLKGYKVSIQSESEIRIDELIEVNKEKGMMFAQVLTQRPRVLIFIRDDFGMNDVHSVVIKQDLKK